MSRRFAAVLLLLFAACAKPPVRDELTLAFEKNDTVVVTAETTFDLKPRTEAAIERVESARASALSATDPWAVRFGRLTPEHERLTYEKERGALERVTRSIRIRTTDLQQVFSDADVTVNLVHGEGWDELHLYPRSSMRATREQRREFDQTLDSWSRDIARYHAVLGTFYTYLKLVPHRAQLLFAEVLGEGQEPLMPLSEDEQPLVDALRQAMDDIAARMDAEEEGAVTFAEQADLIYNPFPARISIDVPGEVVFHEGFTKELVIEPVDPLTSILKLEGRWITPDPLAALLKDDKITAAQLANLPRRVETVTADTIAKTIREELVQPKTFTVRWTAR